MFNIININIITFIYYCTMSAACGGVVTVE